MNARAELRRAVALRRASARDFLEAARAGAHGRTAQRFLGALFAPDFAPLLGQHLLLVFGSLAVARRCSACRWASRPRRSRAAQPVLAAVGVLQTIPSLALLALLIPLTGTHRHRAGADRAVPLRAAADRAQHAHRPAGRAGRACARPARALGLTPRAIAAAVELPLALPTILAGIKTSAVINVGTATIAAFIGAGGFGERIAPGLALNDHAMLLAGAVPAAALALVVHGAVRAGRSASLDRAARRNPNKRATYPVVSFGPCPRS